ncbi:hypothetical protein LF841_05830 [Pseudomonas aeruginosa]|uniref:hypothetical protein n=1 Tax=Pseudomonas aeruginosa TaxID=287 RepID=UPI0020A20A8E|nr:hypothetical protein [Pseudomonas aeruginosa]MCO5621496.1 hypothetical protein [Pseudomonas aeruginosa]
MIGKKIEWLSEMSAAIKGPRDEVASIKFHELVYMAPIAEGTDVIDMLFESYLRPFEGSVMEACSTVLGAVGFSEYYDSLFKIFPELLRQDSDTAMSLLNYPGYELNGTHIRRILKKIEMKDPSGALKKDIDFQIHRWNLTNDEPWSSIYYAN